MKWHNSKLAAFMYTVKKKAALVKAIKADFSEP